MLIEVIETNWCQFPWVSSIALCTSVGVVSWGVSLTRVFIFVRCTLIVYFSTSYAVLNIVIGLAILSRTLSRMVSRSLSCNTAWYVGLELFLFFHGELPVSVMLGRFRSSVALPLSCSFALSFSWSFVGSFSYSFSFSFPFPFSFSFSFSFFFFGFPRTQPISLAYPLWLALCPLGSFSSSQCAYCLLVVRGV